MYLCVLVFPICIFCLGEILSYVLNLWEWRTRRAVERRHCPLAAIVKHQGSEPEDSGLACLVRLDPPRQHLTSLMMIPTRRSSLSRAAVPYGSTQTRRVL
jgi:hypothetical protein